MRRFLFGIFALAVLVLAGCEEKNEPYYVLTVTGVVVDEEGEPIQGIMAYPEGANFYGREGYTDYQGHFGGYVHLAPRREWKICFADVDGTYNRGEYESLTIDITDKVVPPGVPDEWGYSGSCYVELGTIVLKRISD